MASRSLMRTSCSSQCLHFLSEALEMLTAAAAPTWARISPSRRSSPPASTTTSYPSSARSRLESRPSSTTSLARSSVSCPSRSAGKLQREYG